METRKNLTVNIAPSLLRALKLEAVEKEISYSDLLAGRMHRIVDNPDTEALPPLIKKHQNAGNFTGRGRPTSAFIQSHGPVLKKKATFYIDEKLCRKVRKSAHGVGLSVSDLVELALTSAQTINPVLQKTKAGG